MQQVLIVIHLMLVLGMIGVVLLQRSEGGGLGIGGGGGFMTNRGTANILTRATAILAAMFFVSSLLLSIIAGLDRRPTTIIPGGQPTQGPAGPAAPLGGGSGGVLDQLRQQSAPSGPQVPRSQ